MGQGRGAAVAAMPIGADRPYERAGESGGRPCVGRLWEPGWSATELAQQFGCCTRQPTAVPAGALD